MTARLDAETLQGWLSDGREITLVDTLPPAAFEKSHLPGAIHIMSDDILELALSLLPDKQRVIVVYCASENCKRAGLAAERLETLGYTNIHHFTGGKRAWTEAGYALQTVGAPHAS